MLTIIVEKIRTYPEREHFENDIVVKSSKDSTQPLIVTQMSLRTLESRIKERVYTTTEAFVHDIKQLEHNWNIVDRSKTKTLKSIVKYVNSEINELEACVYCYETSFITGEWFVQTCKRPHLLIWAKLKGVRLRVFQCHSIINDEILFLVSILAGESDVGRFTSTRRCEILWCA